MDTAEVFLRHSWPSTPSKVMRHGSSDEIKDWDILSQKCSADMTCLADHLGMAGNLILAAVTSVGVWLCALVSK